MTTLDTEETDKLVRYCANALQYGISDTELLKEMSGNLHPDNAWLILMAAKMLVDYRKTTP